MGRVPRQRAGDAGERAAPARPHRHAGRGDPGAPERHFAVSTAISYYVTGVSAQIVAPHTDLDAATSRDAFLLHTAERWSELDPADHPFLVRAAKDLRDHDDRDQFITGLDMLLGGLSTTADPPPPA